MVDDNSNNYFVALAGWQRYPPNLTQILHLLIVFSQ